jgi:hypothetical protein
VLHRTRTAAKQIGMKSYLPLTAADQPTRQSPIVDTKQDATRQTSCSL